MKPANILNDRPYLCLLAPGVLFILLFLIIPLGSTVTFSFSKYDISKIVLSKFTFENYARFLLDPYYLGILLRTFKFSLLVTFFCLVMGYPVAYFLARTQSRQRGLYLFLLIMPLMVGIIVRTYGWIILLGREGLINKLLVAVGIVDAPVKILYTQAAVVIGLVEISLPFMILPLMSSIQSISVAQEEAASILGANRIQTFTKIVLPLSKPGIISGSLLVLTLSMSALAIPMFLGGPRNTMVAVLVYQQMMTSFNWPFGSAMAIILMVIVFLTLFFYLKIVRGNSATSQ